MISKNEAMSVTWKFWKFWNNFEPQQLGDEDISNHIKDE